MLTSRSIRRLISGRVFYLTKLLNFSVADTSHNFNFILYMIFRSASPCAALLFGTLLFSACSTQSRRDASPSPASKNEKIASASVQKLNIYENEAVPKGSQAILSGTVENTTNATLAKLYVQIELKRRNADERETRTVKITPEQLAPHERGTYSLSIASRDWGSSRIVGLTSATSEVALSYTILPGAKRPPEAAPAAKTIIVDKPTVPRSGNDGFINTPDTPYSVP